MTPRRQPGTARFSRDRFEPLLARVPGARTVACRRLSFDDELIRPRTSARRISAFIMLAPTRRRIIFLDFEYFGWDDPAKMIVDFLLHPAMNLSRRRRKNSLNGVCPFCGLAGLLGRVEAVYPLLA